MVKPLLTGPQAHKQGRVVCLGLAVRPGPDGYEILCTPGPLAAFLHQLSQENAPIRAEWLQGQYLNVIPYTSALDIALTGLVDDLIDLRYTAGRVQLELFSLEEV